MGLIGRTSTDGSSSAAILDDGTLWVVGANSDGELGLGDTTNRTEWTQLGTDTDWAKVYMGGGNFFAIKTDGTLYGAGRNEAGTLGLGSAGVKVLTLTPISSAPKTLDIAASTFQTLLCGMGGGSVHAAGDASMYLGYSDVTEGNVTTFAKTLRGAYKNVFIVLNNKFGLEYPGSLEVWGNGDDGQLGNGSTTPIATPTAFSSDLTFSDISAQTASISTFLIFGVTTGGDLYYWGKQNTGTIASPTFLMSGVKAAANRHIIKTDGSLWVQDGSDSTTFKQVDPGPWTAVHDGGTAVILEKEDGTLWGYGSSNTALGLTEETTVPTLLPISTVPAEYGIIVGDMLILTEDQDKDSDKAVWYPLADATSITLDRANGELQTVTLRSSCTITPPILTKDKSTLLLQVTTSSNSTQVIVGGTIVVQKLGIHQIGWFFDGSATRRYPTVKVV